MASEQDAESGFGGADEARVGPLDLGAEHHEVEVRVIECPAQVGAAQLDEVVAAVPAP